MADRAKVPDRSWCYRLYYAIFGKSYCQSDESLPKALEAMVEPGARRSNYEDGVAGRQPAVDSCYLHTVGNCVLWTHLAAVYEKFEIDSVYVIPVNSAGQRCELYLIATGKNDAPVSWFAPLHRDNREDNEDDDASDLRDDDLEQCDVQTPEIPQPVMNARESLALQNEMHKTYYMRAVKIPTRSGGGDEESDLPVSSCSSDTEVLEAKRTLLAFAESLADKLKRDPGIFLPAVKEFVKNGEKLSTDSATDLANMQVFLVSFRKRIRQEIGCQV
ncbi:hypothetical protein BSL78_06212 [Apostichopus japonicus]|uniref:Uncharacterized protein n=1 Tax=Stichopus japonicus TaxID=307972 RepID=A0A2G8L9F4_STIJA|nr:hypothetical protein BSL78_06212 [Apostichopus japonicus]